MIQPKAQETIDHPHALPLALACHRLRVNGKTRAVVEYVRDAEQNMRSHDPTRQDLRKQSTLLNSLGVSFDSHRIRPFLLLL
jgi:hypothetical protein